MDAIDDIAARAERIRADFAARAERVNFLQEEAQRLRVIWDKAANMYAAFYAELENLRPQITDQLLDDWCFWNLSLGLETLNRTARILSDADADRTRASLRVARDIAKREAAEERARLAAERAAQMAVEEEARRLREAEAAAKKAEAERLAALATARLSARSGVTPALIATIKARLMAGEPLREDAIAKEFGCTRYVVRSAGEQARGEIRAEALHAGVIPAEPQKKRGRPRHRDSRDSLAEMSGPDTLSQPALAEEPDLAKKFHAAYARLSGARSVWVEATLEIASVLRQARERSPSNAAFSAWLKENGIDAKISEHSRAALIGLAADPAAARAALENTDSWSWELIWRKVNHLASARKMVNDDPDAPSQALH